jgi:hypothetical protein
LISSAGKHWKSKPYAGLRTPALAGVVREAALSYAPHPVPASRGDREPRRFPVPFDSTTIVPPRDTAMAQATLKNQQKILTGHRAIVSNQKKILRNQERLLLVLANEVIIIRNQEAIIKNQKKILANQAKIAAK